MTKREQVYEKYSGHCAYCGKIITIKEMQVDHIIPKNGHSYYSYGIDVDGIDNLNPSCRRCNHYKRSHPLEFYRMLIKTLHERIRDIYICKVAEDYGIIEIKEWDGEFYFDLINKEYQRTHK
jgi:hypothetical protein